METMSKAMNNIEVIGVNVHWNHGEIDVLIDESEEVTLNFEWKSYGSIIDDITIDTKNLCFSYSALNLMCAEIESSIELWIEKNGTEAKYWGRM